MTEPRETSRATPVDPVAMARRDLKKSLPRRFYAQATSGPLIDAGHPAYGVFLDGKPVRTPAKALLAVPTSEFAEALAAEWRNQADIIEPDAMPLTRLANSAIDGVATAVDATATAVAKFAETDLVCYRAADPAALAGEQAAAWDPVLALVRDRLGVRFLCIEGVMYAAQPEAALAAVRRAVDEVARGPDGAFRLAALSVMTSLAGSVLLALATSWGALTAAETWAVAHLDEDYQMRLWGPDAEALQRRERRWRDMAAATLCFELCDTARRR